MTRAASLSQSVTSFGASLYRQLTSGNLDNLIFSPFSVFVALAMTLLGANGNTKRELMTVLSVGRQQGVHQTLHNAIASLPTGLDPDTNLTLRVANAVYYNQSRITVLPGFSQNIQRLYGRALKPLEQPNPEAAINSWVEEVTDGMIQNLLPPGHITNSNTVLMLLNAVFFEGFWVNQFSTSHTSESDFTTATGSVVRVPMMYQSDAVISFNNIEALNAQVIELPYTGDRFSLFLIMPNTWDGLMNLERRLDGQMLNRILNNMRPTVSADLHLPKFRLSTGKELNDHLMSMGLRTALSRRADFRRMSLRPLYISKVIHKAIIELEKKDEESIGNESKPSEDLDLSIVPSSLPPSLTQPLVPPPSTSPSPPPTTPSEDLDLSTVPPSLPPPSTQPLVPTPSPSSSSPTATTSEDLDLSTVPPSLPPSSTQPLVTSPSQSPLPPTTLTSEDFDLSTTPPSLLQPSTQHLLPPPPSPPPPPTTTSEDLDLSTVPPSHPQPSTQPLVSPHSPSPSPPPTTSEDLDLRTVPPSLPLPSTEHLLPVSFLSPPPPPQPPPPLPPRDIRRGVQENATKPQKNCKDPDTEVVEDLQTNLKEEKQENDFVQDYPVLAVYLPNL
ncbi:hypothetical protein C0Q70_20960 [Pomacea canaliculata]|uniref:Serpin domain-containing protein n=1 Tax=Pomacea canaliculata TaxID=400727 RepID=A0A2T7NB75_POMCA|nr:hypothetical protein C0Q70_20960 [Pomacea canaliculata]